MTHITHILSSRYLTFRYYIDYLASGTGNIIYNGSYYYHRHSSSMLVKYDLDSTDEAQMDLGDISYLDCARKQDHTFEVPCLINQHNKL